MLVEVAACFFIFVLGGLFSLLLLPLWLRAMLKLMKGRIKP